MVEFSLCLLFAKLVSYTFLFWLPLYITNVDHLDAKKAGELSTLFDVGGIFGESVTTAPLLYRQWLMDTRGPGLFELTYYREENVSPGCIP